MTHKPLTSFAKRPLLLLSFVLLTACSGRVPDDLLTTKDPIRTLAEPGVRVILDTDLGIDVDDAGALAVLHALADKGEVRILATVANVNDPYAPGALDAINTYYGRPNIPVGRNSKQQYS